MKNVIIVLLIAAIGVGVYFYFNKKHKTQTLTSKELILGKWKIDSLIAKIPSDSLRRSTLDTSRNRFQVEFTRDSSVLETVDGQLNDSSRYRFTSDKDFVISNHSDSAKQLFTINQLDSSSMILKDKTNSLYYFRRIK